MRHYPGTGANDHIRADDGERPDVDIRRQLGLGVDDRARVDQTTISLRAHMRSALATTRPSTLTSPLNFQMPRTARVSRTSKIKCSPGTTGRRGKWPGKKCSLKVTFLSAVSDSPGV